MEAVTVFVVELYAHAPPGGGGGGGGPIRELVLDRNRGGIEVRVVVGRIDIRATMQLNVRDPVVRVKRVVACARVERVGAGTADDVVVPLAAGNGVVARAAVRVVVQLVQEDDVVAVSAVDEVGLWLAISSSFPSSP